MDEEGTHSFLFFNNKFYQLINKNFILMDLTINLYMTSFFNIRLRTPYFFNFLWRKIFLSEIFKEAVFWPPESFFLLKIQKFDRFWSFFGLLK
jgi:hypothetical protein